MSGRGKNAGARREEGGSEEHQRINREKKRERKVKERIEKREAAHGDGERKRLLLRSPYAFSFFPLSRSQEVRPGSGRSLNPD